MGLDMYLTKKIYIGANYEHNDVKGKIKLERHGKPVNINLNRVTNVEEQIGYWRKANQIHNWFVQNIQEGKDDCGSYYVEIDEIKNLLETCKKVKENPVSAKELLPTQKGFFFGDINYDKNYMYDIDNTITILEELLAEYNKGDYNGDIYYQSSW